MIKRAILLSGLGVALCGIATGQTPAVPKFGLHEVKLRATGNYANPYTDLAAEATLTEPDGKAVRTAPLFWDGDATWRFRFSPDETGTWK